MSRQGKRVVECGARVEAFFPELIQAVACVNAPQSQDILGPRSSPEHSGLFAARADDGLAAGFNHARTNEETLFSEGAILHARDVIDEIAQCLLDVMGPAPVGRLLAGFSNEFFVSGVPDTFQVDVADLIGILDLVEVAP